MRVQGTSSESGFTLVEVLVAGFLLRTGLLARAYCSSQGLSTIISSQQDSPRPPEDPRGIGGRADGSQYGQRPSGTD